MKIFADTAEVDEISLLKDLGLVDGVTTNPTIIARSGRDIRTVIREICEIVSGPVSAEVTSSDADTMLIEGRTLSRIAPNVVVKLPMTWEGLKACRALSSEGVGVNLTLCFTVNQALLAAKAGAMFVSPFVGRLDDINLDGEQLIRDIRMLFDNYEYTTSVLAASIRSVNHISTSALAGADAITAPAKLLEQMVSHPLTRDGLEVFMNDAKSSHFSGLLSCHG